MDARQPSVDAPPDARTAWFASLESERIVDNEIAGVAWVDDVALVPLLRRLPFDEACSYRPLRAARFRCAGTRPALKIVPPVFEPASA